MFSFDFLVISVFNGFLTFYPRKYFLSIPEIGMGNGVRREIRDYFSSSSIQLSGKDDGTGIIMWRNRRRKREKGDFGKVKSEEERAKMGKGNK